MPPPSSLSGPTCLDEQELLGLGAHLVGCCAVVAAKVVLGVRRDLTDRKDQKKLNRERQELQLKLTEHHCLRPLLDHEHMSS